MKKYDTQKKYSLPEDVHFLKNVQSQIKGHELHLMKMVSALLVTMLNIREIK